MSSEAHRAAADGRIVALGLVTVSDSRTAATDENGRWLAGAVAAAGHRIARSDLVPDDSAAIDSALTACLADGCQVIIVNGGTGIGRRDNTADVVIGRFDKVLPGFGELFRMLSWEAIGAAAMLSRAAAGTIGDAVVFAVPGSPKAVELAWDRLIAPEIAHLAWELVR